MNLHRLDRKTKDHLNSTQTITSVKDICKELVENSIDASSTFIQLIIKNDSIQIIDDGIGLDPDFVIQRNQTSKIQTFEEIENAKGFGFRGTALDSISYMSRLNIKSCQCPPLGTEWEYKNGEMISKSQKAMKKGTWITITDLFSNIPVRLLDYQKYKKKYHKECIDFLYYYCFLPIRFKIVHEKTIETFGDVAESIVALYGQKQLSDMFYINTETVSGYISKPKSTCLRRDRSRQFCFLNSRPIVFKQLSKKLIAAFKEWTDFHPCFVLFLSVPLDRFDRNVTPDKMTILMEDDESFMDGIIAEISLVLEPLRGEMNTLDTPSSVPIPRPTYTQTQIQSSCCDHEQKSCLSVHEDVLGSQESSMSSQSSQPKVYSTPTRIVSQLWKDQRDIAENDNTPAYANSLLSDHPTMISVSLDSMAAYFPPKTTKYESKESNLDVPVMVSKQDFEQLHIIGQFNLGFILASHKGPRKLVLTPQQEYKLEERLESLLEGGYDIGKKEETWYLVGLPLVQGLLLGEKDLMETLELKSGQQCSRLQRFFASKACRSAVMIGDALTKKQMQEIVRKMGQLDQPWNCPHGRPTMRILHKLEIV